MHWPIASERAASGIAPQVLLQLVSVPLQAERHAASHPSPLHPGHPCAHAKEALLQRV
jgi:hypothetical protein